jgi:hypothetical protein
VECCSRCPPPFGVVFIAGPGLALEGDGEHTFIIALAAAHRGERAIGAQSPLNDISEALGAGVEVEAHDANSI